MEQDRVRLAVVTGAHGIKGWVRLKSLAEDPALLFGGALFDGKGVPVALTPRGSAGGHLLASLEGVTDRNAAEILRGTELFAEAATLPSSDDDGYRYDDLIGLAVLTTDGAPYGTVTGMHDFGAGDVIEIARENMKSELFAFDDRSFPAVDLAAGHLVIDPPEILSGKAP